MSPVRVRALALAATALVALPVLLAGCGSGGVADVAGAGEQTALNTPTPPPATLSEVDLAAIVDRRKPEIIRAARKFRACDGPVSVDNFTKSPCVGKVAAETAAIDALLGDLTSVEVPATKAVLVTDLKRMSAAGAKVAVKCAKANDQPCDQALARFRADEQSVLWDLDLTL